MGVKPRRPQLACNTWFFPWRPYVRMTPPSILASMTAMPKWSNSTPSGATTGIIIGNPPHFPRKPKPTQNTPAKNEKHPHENYTPIIRPNYCYVDSDCCCLCLPGPKRTGNGQHG